MLENESEGATKYEGNSRWTAWHLKEFGNSEGMQRIFGKRELARRDNQAKAASWSKKVNRYSYWLLLLAFQCIPASGFGETAIYAVKTLKTTPLSLPLEPHSRCRLHWYSWCARDFEKTRHWVVLAPSKSTNSAVHKKRYLKACLPSLLWRTISRILNQ